MDKISEIGFGHEIDPGSSHILLGYRLEDFQRLFPGLELSLMYSNRSVKIFGDGNSAKKLLNDAVTYALQKEKQRNK